MGVIVAKELLKFGVKIGISWIILKSIQKKFVKEFGFDPGAILKDTMKMTKDVAEAMKQETGTAPTTSQLDDTGKVVELT
ncbi:MAG: hypothetical protein J6U54_11750 [Clostridiales bacterium]|nr:hypothetical protein [Clostridiales bacterium]